MKTPGFLGIATNRFDRALYSNEVDDIALNRLKIKGYRGCYADNNFPHLNHGECMIINYQASYEPGSHYTALRRHYGQLIHFDSLGFPIDEPIMNYAKKYNFTFINYNVGSHKSANRTEQIQADDSYYCGHYCLLFLTLVNKPGDVFKFYDLFNGTPEQNDKKIKQLIKTW